MVITFGFERINSAFSLEEIYKVTREKKSPYITRVT